MTLDEARALLGTCRREELRDHAFGDVEVYWRDGKSVLDVAFGYFGNDHDEVTVGGEIFEGADARALRDCGALGRVERNDSSGPDDYREGTCMPGLTREGVLAEITAPESKP